MQQDKAQGLFSLHQGYRNTMRRIFGLLLLLAGIQLLAWLTPPQFGPTGIPGYLPLHTLFETVSIVVAMLVFAVGWNSRSPNLPGNAVLLACVFFAIGWLDFSHTISYHGMPDFYTPNDTEKQLNFWLSARFLASFVLLVVAIRIWSPLRSKATRYVLMGALLGITVFINWLVLFHQDWLPHTFIPGQGLTPLKKNLEYLFITFNVITALILLLKMRTKQAFSITNLFAAVCVMAMSELYFTLYTTMTGGYNVLGHVYKVISYLFIYRAIVVEAIEYPYNKLAQTQLNLGLALKASNTGLWDWDLRSNVVNYSPEWKAQLGYSADELANNFSTWQSLLHPADKEHALKVAQDFVASAQTTYENEFRLRHRDSSYRWILARGEKQLNSQGKAIRLVGSHVDISERMQRENEAQEMREQLTQATKMESVGHLTAGIAHDFNNILGAMMGFTELSKHMLAAGTTESIGRYHDEILNAGNRAKQLIAQMLTFSRLSADDKDAPITILSTIVKEVVSLLRSSIPTTVDLNYTIENESLKARIQPVQLHQIILNLGINARDAMGEYGKIDISLNNFHCDTKLCSSCNMIFSGNCAQLTVKDSGSGIPSHLLNKIFDPFFTTKGIGKGTGMGLSVVHGLVHAVGGHLYVESSAGNGTAFHILLPLESTEAGTPEIGGTKHGACIKGARIMVVDDEHAITTMLQEYLSAFGADIVAFNDPAHALESFIQNSGNIDLLITDETMPGISGMHLAQKFLKIRPVLPIVLCTGYSEHATPESTSEIGIRGFFYKPLDMTELLQKIHELLGSRLK